MSLERSILAVEAITDFSALFLANPATDFTSIATLLNRKKTKQAVVMKTGRQLIDTVLFMHG